MINLDFSNVLFKTNQVYFDTNFICLGRSIRYYWCYSPINPPPPPPPWHPPPPPPKPPHCCERLEHGNPPIQLYVMENPVAWIWDLFPLKSSRATLKLHGVVRLELQPPPDPVKYKMSIFIKVHRKPSKERKTFFFIKMKVVCELPWKWSLVRILIIIV